MPHSTIFQLYWQSILLLEETRVLKYNTLVTSGLLYICMDGTAESKTTHSSLNSALKKKTAQR